MGQFKSAGLLLIMAGFIAVCTPCQAQEPILRCWGSNTLGQTSVPDDMGTVGQAIVSIAAGRLHTCALTAERNVRCWGWNFYGQTSVPVDIENVFLIVAGSSHTCAVTGVRLNVRCWGSNDHGQTDVPVDIGDPVVGMAAGLSHTCAVTNKNVLHCWGWNNAGQTSVPDDIGVVYVIAAGSYHTCADTLRGVRCWGANNTGQTSVPVGISSPIAGGFDHTCGSIFGEFIGEVPKWVFGGVRCWGANDAGQTSAPVGIGTVKRIAAGDFATCAVTSAGVLRCWGSNALASVPVDISTNTHINEVALGALHACAMYKRCTDVNCLQCGMDVQECTLCSDGYVVADSGQCTRCPDGYGFNSGQCTGCSDFNCEKCTLNAGECTQCADGFGVNLGQCTRCNDASCLKCALNAGECTQCYDGYGVESGQCTACSDYNCQTCALNPGECTQCIDVHGFEFGQCTRCHDANCFNCALNAGECRQCDDGYGFESGESGQCTLLGMEGPYGTGNGDPHFVGFDGTPFFFDGYLGATFALLSEREHQVNALFGSIGPNAGRDSMIWMTGFGVRYRDVLSVEVYLDPPLAELAFYEDKTIPAERNTTKRVYIPEHALHIEVNGVHHDELLGSGTSVGGLPDGVVAYFPPKSAVNPGDATDGPVVVIATPVMQLTIYMESEDAMHLDLKTIIRSRVTDMHGVLGQTLAWVKDGPGAAIVDGVMHHDSEFETDGLLGTSFKHSAWGKAPGGMTVMSRKIKSKMHAAGPDPLDAIIGLMAEATHARRHTRI